MIIVQRGVPARPGEGRTKVLIEMTEREASRLLMAIHHYTAVAVCPYCEGIMRDLAKALIDEGVNAGCPTIAGME
jgi:ATP-dependent Clp protease adapter protein ClpS